MRDFCLNEYDVFLYDERDLLIQQIDMLFETNTDEVFGEKYGSEFYKFLWDLNSSASDIIKYTKSVIYKEINLMDWELDVTTEILQGTNNDIILIGITLSKYSNVIKKTYRID